jgi:hypothetical protein
MKFNIVPHIGLVIAGGGLALYGVDVATSKPGTNCNSGGQPFNLNYCGSVYGPGAPLAGFLTAAPIDPTVLIVSVGMALWLWQRYGK